MPPPELNATRCVRYRYRYSSCERCASACPHQAIALHDAGVTVSAQACQSCALCVAVCPTQALSQPDFEPIALLRQAIRKPSYTLACAPSGQHGDAIVPCLGAIDAVWLAYMARRGLPVLLRGSSHCSVCRHAKPGASQWAAALEAVQALHQALTQADPESAPVWAMPVHENQPVSQTEKALTAIKKKAGDARRGFLKRLLRPRQSEPSKTSPQPLQQGAIRAGAYIVSEPRELLHIVCRQDQPAELVWHEALPLLALTLNSGCTLCEACFRVCPTAAITITETPEDWALDFDQDRCVGCLACLDVCQPKVLDAHSHLDPRPGQPPVRLIAQVKQRCRRCDRHFISAQPQAECPVCSDDALAFDAIFGSDEAD